MLYFTGITAINNPWTLLAYPHFIVKETENIEGAHHLLSQDLTTDVNDSKVYTCPLTLPLSQQEGSTVL